MLFLINKLTIIIIIVAAVIVILALAIIIFKLTHYKHGIKIESFMSTMLLALGGIENIKDYSVENARVKFELNDVNLAKLDTLKELSPKGVFITNNCVKTLFKYESSDIVKNLSKIKK